MVSLNDVLLAMSNIPVDDPIAEIWGRGLQGGHEIIEYTGTLPITINADGNALIDYCIYGNTVQTGTPMPEAPVDVAGCGVRTENLFDKTAISTDNGYIPDGFLHTDGTKTTNITYRVSEYIAIDAHTAYMLYCAVPLNLPAVCFYDSDKNFISGVSYSVRDTIPFTTPQDAKFLRLSYRYIDRDAIMLNLGSTALPYEPYGYKLPILSNSTVTNIYLGEVETTRRIKKLVLTGEENWRTLSTPNYTYAVPITPYLVDTTAISSHFIQRRTLQVLTTKTFMLASGNEIYIKYNDKTSINDFKQFLADQYANGTPVTVWYVLAEPETGIVNEPLMKINDYADTVSMEQADVSIPTIAGTTVIDYDGTPKPSQMYIKYRR